MIQLSAVILTLNEEEKIGQCIASLKPVIDDIVVIDAMSTDRTAEICKSHGVNFIQRPWQGYPQSRNFGNTQAKNDMILSIDADEYLSEELADSIKNIHDDQMTYSFVFITHFCGKWMKYGAFHIRNKTRIFNRQHAHFREENLVHEQMIWTKKVPRKPLSGYLYHDAYPDLDFFLFKQNKYSSLSAKQSLARNKKGTLLFAVISGFYRFFKEYFFKLGFLEGKYGFVVASYGFHYNFTKIVKTFVRDPQKLV